MVTWLIESDEDFEIKRVANSESKISIFSLVESRDRIGDLICAEPDVEKAQKLMQIRRDLNVIINQGA